MNESSLISRIESYLAECAPHVKQRISVGLLAEALEELKRNNDTLRGEMMIKDYSMDKLKAELRRLGGVK